MSCGKVDKVQIHLTSQEGDFYSDEIGGVGIRGNMVVLPVHSEARRVGFSGRETRVLRLYDSIGNTIVDTNATYDGDFTMYEVPESHKLIGFNCNLRYGRNLENIGIITCEQ